MKLVLLLILVGAVLYVNADCTFSGYDSLSSLQINLTSSDTKTSLYSLEGPDTYMYYWNLCGGTVTSDIANKGCQGASVCQENPSSGAVTTCGVPAQQTISAFNSTMWDYWAGVAGGSSYPSDDGVQFFYGGGKACSTSTRQSFIQVSCDSKGSYTANTNNAALGIFTDESDTVCNYYMFMTSSFACSGKGGSGSHYIDPGWIIIFFCCIAFWIYLVVGIAYQFKFKEARGMDLIPNLNFWKDIPFLMYDGCAFVIQKVTMGKVCAGYTPIASA